MAFTLTAGFPSFKNKLKTRQSEIKNDWKVFILNAAFNGQKTGTTYGPDPTMIPGKTEKGGKYSVM